MSVGAYANLSDCISQKSFQLCEILCAYCPWVSWLGFAPTTVQYVMYFRLCGRRRRRPHNGCSLHFSAYAQCTWAKALSAFFTTLQITDSIRHGTSFAVYLYPVANIACAKKLGFMVRVSRVSVRVRLSELSQRRIGHWALVLRMSLNSLTHLSAVGDSTGIEKRCMWNLSSNYVTGQHCHTTDNAFCCSC